MLQNRDSRPYRPGVVGQRQAMQIEIVASAFRTRAGTERTADYTERAAPVLDVIVSRHLCLQCNQVLEGGRRRWSATRVCYLPPESLRV